MIRFENPTWSRASAALLALVLILPALAADPPKNDPQLKGQPLSSWVKLLTDTDPLTREEALNVLANAGPKIRDQAADAIRPLLKDESAPLRQRAAIVIWKLNDDADPALTMFRQDLKDKDQDTRLRAAQYLLEMGPEVRGVAPALVEALGITDKDLRPKIHTALRKAGPRGMTALIAGLDSSDDAVADEALLTLEEYLPGQPRPPQAFDDGRPTFKMKDDALQTLRAKQKTGTLKTRLRVAELVGKSYGVDADSIWPTIKEGCAAEDSTSRTRAYSLLLGRPLRNTNAPVRIRGRFPAKELEATFEKGLSDDDPANRIACACRLCRSDFPSKKALATLDEALKKEIDPTDNAEVLRRLEILQAVDQAGGAAADLIPTLLDLLRREAAVDPQLSYGVGNALAGMGADAAPALEPLVALLKKDDARRNAAALEVLTTMGPAARTATAPLLKYYKDLGAKKTDEPQPVQPRYALGLKEKVVMALAALQPRNDKEALALAEELLKGEKSRLRLFAANLLWTVDPAQAKKAVAVMVEALDDPNLRYDSEHMLGQMGSDARDAVRPLAERMYKTLERPPVQMDFIYTFQGIGPEAHAALPAILSLLKDPQTQPHHVSKSVERLGLEPKTAAPMLIDVLNTAKYHHFLLYELLGDCGAQAKDAIPALTKEFDEARKNQNAYIGVAIADALVRIDADQAKTVAPYLAEVMRGKDKRTAAQAAVILYGIDANPDAYDVVRAAIEHPHDDLFLEWLPSQTMHQLGKLGPKARGVVPLLAKYLEDDKAPYPTAAAVALWRIDAEHQNVPAFLAKLLNDPNPDTRRNAADALAELGSDAKAVLPALEMERAGRGREVRDAARDAIRRIEADVALKDGLISPQSLPTPPKVERPDPRAYLADKRLNVKLKLVAKDPKVEEMLRALADATKLKFTAHPTLLKLQPDFGKVSFPSISASELMTVIATEFADGAYWKKTEDGYILTNPDLDGKKPGK